MAVALSAESRKQALASIKRFWTENLDAEVGGLQTIALLDFLLAQVGFRASQMMAPSI